MSGEPFVLAVVGDFGGRRRGLSGRRFLRVDRDNIDAVMADLDVSFEEDVPSALDPATAGRLRVSLDLRCIADFHPDQIVKAVPQLAELLGARSRPPDQTLLERFAPRTDSSAGVESIPTLAGHADLLVKRDEQGGGGADAHGDTKPEASRPPQWTAGSLLDSIIAAADSSCTPVPETPRHLPSSPELKRFARDLVEPFLDRTDHDAQAAWRAALDRVIGEQLRSIFHHPRFRALEAAWRGLGELVSSAETGPELEVRILDLSRDEIEAEVSHAGKLENGCITELICEEPDERIGRAGYAAILANYEFGPDPADIRLLAKLGRMAAMAEAPFIGGASVELLGLSKPADLADPSVRERLGGGGSPATWRNFRSSKEAESVALCFPRVLLRVPYGASGEPVASISFSEIPSRPEPGHFLWGSSAIAFGRVLTRAFSRDGWNLAPESDATLEELPVFVHHEAAEEHALPCAEVAMSDATISWVAEEGVIVLGAYRDQDQARFFGVRTSAGTSLSFAPSRGSPDVR